MKGTGRMRTVVLGLGNILLGDEAVGVRVVEASEARLGPLGDVAFVDGGTSTMELLDQLAGAEALVIVDALRGDEPPGTVVRVDGSELPAFFGRTRLSPHQVGLPDLLAALGLLEAAPREVVLIGIVPESLAQGLGLTPAVAAALPRACAAVEAELARLGALSARETATCA